MREIDIEKFRSFYLNSNISISEIRQEFGIHKSTIYEWVKKLNLSKIDRSSFMAHVKGKRPQGELELNEFRNNWADLSKQELTKKYNVTWSTLRQWASDFEANRDVNTNKRRLEKLEYINSEKALQNREMPEYEELIDLAIKNSELIGQYLFTPVIIETEIVTDKPIGLTFTADWHLGHMGVDYIQFGIDVNLIEQTDGLYCYAGGDLRENIIEAGKIESSLNQQPILWQNMLFIRTIEKLKSKIVALGSGTHDWDTYITGMDRLAELAKSLKIVYTDVGGLLKLTVGNQVYNIFRTHKFKFHSQFNLTHACKQLWRLGEYDADIIVIEHRHVAAYESFFGHGIERIGIRTGTYKISDDYARKEGFYGLSVKSPTVILFPNVRKMIPFLDIDNAIPYLKTVRNENNNN